MFKLSINSECLIETPDFIIKANHVNINMSSSKEQVICVRLETKPGYMGKF
jgi:hypothetical protein